VIVVVITLQPIRLKPVLMTEAQASRVPVNNEACTDWTLR
jgi:hypothetical protein